MAGADHEGAVMSMVECMSCGLWVASDEGNGAYEKENPFRWKCDECMAEDGQKPDDHGYITVDQEAVDNANEAAWERQQEAFMSEPPPTLREQQEKAWKEKKGIKC